MTVGETQARTSVHLAKVMAVAFLVLAFATTSCSSSKPRARPDVTTTVKPPKYTSGQQSLYFHDLSRNVPSLSTYVNEKGKSALVALLAYGAGFCGFLRAGQDPATALSSLESQAQNLVSKTGFQGSTADYQSIGTDALIALCPSQQKSLTASEQTLLQQIAHNLAGS